MVGVELGERLVCAALTLLLLAGAGEDPALVCGAVVAGSYGAAAFSFCVLFRLMMRSLPRRGELPPVARRAVPLGLNDALRSGLGTVEQFLIPHGLEKNGSRHTALAAYGTVSGMVFPVLWFPAELIFSLCELLVSELARLLAKKEHRRLSFFRLGIAAEEDVAVFQPCQGSAFRDANRLLPRRRRADFRRLQLRDSLSF